MSLTNTQFRSRVAQHLRVHSPDQELDSETAEKLDDAIADASAELREKGLCWWGAETIPQSVVFAFTLIVSAQACMKVGKADQGYEAGDADGRARLSQLRNSADTDTLATDYY